MRVLDKRADSNEYAQAIPLKVLEVGADYDCRDLGGIRRPVQNISLRWSWSLVPLS